MLSELQYVAKTLPAGQLDKNNPITNTKPIPPSRTATRSAVGHLPTRAKSELSLTALHVSPPSDRITPMPLPSGVLTSFVIFKSSPETLSMDRARIRNPPNRVSKKCNGDRSKVVNVGEITSVRDVRFWFGSK